MAGEQRGGPAAVDWQEWARALREFAERGARVWAQAADRAAKEDLQIPDPALVARTLWEAFAKLQADPGKLAEAQARFWSDWMALWEVAARRLAGQEAPPVAEPEPGDRRFKGKEWNEEVAFDLIKQAYLLSARWLLASVRELDGLDEATARKVAFYTRQYVDAVAPTNFAATNPRVWRETLESGGKNLLRGLDRLLTDLERGRGRLAISMTDESAFEVGRNLALTPGKVVFQNDLMQLLQYDPATPTVYRRPLVIVPPWINKYYILDLQPKNSFIRWAVEKGHTVFVLSWVNPDESLAHKDFEDYMAEGPLAAFDAVEAATGEREVNAIGYCIGGTLLAATLAYLAAHGDDRVHSATFFTSLVDFSEPGELSVFIDEEQLALLDRQMAAKGYLEGRHMAQVFNLLRENDLIWSFYVNNYLLGTSPRPFDLLYWNSDSTRMPAMMHSFYLRKMYLENRLVEPGGISLQGTPIDLRQVRVPVYILSTREDHIAPWKSTYAATRIYSGPVRFVLSGSGHIAGVINPPASGKYGYWTCRDNPPSPEEWLARATAHEGSWWPHWHRWVRRFGGGRVPARVPGDGRLAPIEDAPGSYVKVRHAE
ncbi:MAG: class I poly(R)-hydroxyalkanoic acid synthase [Deferrisomatales bacterium]